MNKLAKLTIAATSLGLAASSLAQTWTPLNNQPPAGIGLSVLMTDGTVMSQQYMTNKWWSLRPDINGSYKNGTWTQLASSRSDWGPLYYASAVLADGRFLAIGGEYNGLASNDGWSKKGAIYNPQTNTWTNLAGPGWSAFNSIGDVQCAVLPDGKFLLASLGTSVALLDPVTLSWSDVSGTGKVGRLNEESWTLLPDGTIHTVNCWAPGSQRYIPWLKQWIDAGDTIVSLVDDGSKEIGPGVLMMDGKVLTIGATGHNAIWTKGQNLMDKGTWAALPDFPNMNGLPLTTADGPGCLLPNGRVLCCVSPGVFQTPTRFFEFNGSTFTEVPATPNSPGNPSYVGNMLMLPTGEMMFTDFSNNVQLYTSAGSPQNAWRPTISQVPSALLRKKSFVLKGTQLNGLSQTCFYGDDSAQYTNYPIVRIKNNASGHVFYCRTSGHSSMGVATGSTLQSTNVYIPANVELGASTIQVIANGIASAAIPVSVTDGITNVTPSALGQNSGPRTLSISGFNFTNQDKVVWTFGSATTLTPTFINSNSLQVSIPNSLLQTLGKATVHVKGAIGDTNTWPIVIGPNVVLSSMNPTTTVVGASLRLTLKGSGFDKSCNVVVGTSKIRGIYLSPTQLYVNVPPSTFTTPGTYPVKVINSYGVESSSLSLRVAGGAGA